MRWPNTPDRRAACVTPTSGTPALTASRLLTADELADRWQVATAHVYRLAREGDLPVVRIGRYMRFHADQVEAWEQAGGSGTA